MGATLTHTGTSGQPVRLSVTMRLAMGRASSMHWRSTQTVRQLETPNTSRQVRPTASAGSMRAISPAARLQ